MARKGRPYPSPGVCIYCLKSSEALGKEHIVPAALNGSWSIERAACKSCQQRTNEAYENAVLNSDTLRVARILLELRRRNRGKKQRRLHLPPVFPGGTAHQTSVRGLPRIELPTGLYPPILTMPAFEPAGTLVGANRHTNRAANPNISPRVGASGL